MRKCLPVAAAIVLALGPAAAQDKPELVIYTYESFVSEWGPGPAIAASFEETCGCAVRFVGAGDGAALLGRLRLEGARSDADIVLGLDTNLTADAAATGLFAPHGVEGARARPPRRLGRPDLPALRLGLFRVRLRRDAARRGARQLRGADRLGHVDRDPRPAQLDPRPRPADVGQGRLRGPRARDLGRPRAAHRHGHAGLVGGLRIVPERRGRHGARLHDLARLPPDRRGRRRQARGPVRRGALHADRGRGRDRGLRRARARARASSTSCSPTGSSRISRRRTGCIRPARPTAGCPRATRRFAVPETPLLLSPEAARDARDAALDEWLRALSR